MSLSEPLVSNESLEAALQKDRAYDAEEPTGCFKGCCIHFWMGYILMWLAFFTIQFHIITIIFINYFVGNIKSVYVYNILLTIAIYILMAQFFHSFYAFISRPYKSNPTPKHLIIIIHGWLGFHIRMSHIREILKNIYLSKKTDQGIMIFISQTNSNGYFLFPYYKTNDGIMRGGNRIQKEIENVLKTNPTISKVSFIGCSLGGLYSRYVAAKLSKHFEELNISLMNYISLGSPHIGIEHLAKNKKTCCTTQYGMAQYTKKWCCCNKYELSGYEMVLCDNGGAPNNLLYKMANDDEYLNVLKKFRNIMCYGNIRFDALVEFQSAVILRDKGGDDGICDLLVNKYEKRVIDEKLGCLFTEITKEDCEEKQDDNKDIECWYKRLDDEIPWKKIGVYFNHNYSARALAHQYLIAPVYYYRICAPLKDSLRTNFIF